MIINTLCNIISCKTFKNSTIICNKSINIINNHNHNHKHKMSNKIPSSLKHNIWIKYIGEKYEGKCGVTWCVNKITPFTFEAGHNIPYSKGGSTTIDNLRPICSDCNKSMGNRYTIDEYSEIFKDKDKDKDTNITIASQYNTTINNINDKNKHINTKNKTRIYIYNILCPCISHTN